MAAMPIYGKNLKKISETGGLISTKQGLWSIIVCINHDLGLDLDLFYGKVKFGHIGCLMEKSENVFLRTICSQKEVFLLLNR